MQPINLHAALIAANQVNFNGANALVETSILRQLVASCLTRIDALDADAKQLAVLELAKRDLRSGSFEHDGHHYTLDRTLGYDLADYNRYKQPEAVQWRKDKRERDIARKNASSFTTSMKSQMDKFITLYGDTKTPDTIDLTLKCLD